MEPLPHEPLLNKIFGFPLQDSKHLFFAKEKINSLFPLRILPFSEHNKDEKTIEDSYLICPLFGHKPPLPDRGYLFASENNTYLILKRNTKEVIYSLSSYRFAWLSGIDPFFSLFEVTIFSHSKLFSLTLESALWICIHDCLYDKGQNLLLSSFAERTTHLKNLFAFPFFNLLPNLILHRPLLFSWSTFLSLETKSEEIDLTLYPCHGFQFRSFSSSSSCFEWQIQTSSLTSNFFPSVQASFLCFLKEKSNWIPRLQNLETKKNKHTKKKNRFFLFFLLLLLPSLLHSLAPFPNIHLPW